MMVFIGRSCLVFGLALLPLVASAQLYRGSSAAPAQRANAIAPAPVVKAGGAEVLEAAGNPVDDYLDESFALVEPSVASGQLGVAIRGLLDSAKRSGRAKDAYAAMQLRSIQIYELKPEGLPATEMVKDVVFKEASAALTRLSERGDPDAYYVFGMLYSDGVWLPIETRRATDFFRAAAAAGHVPAKEYLRLNSYSLK
jgi:TPR repeat protein